MPERLQTRAKNKEVLRVLSVGREAERKSRGCAASCGARTATEAIFVGHCARTCFELKEISAHARCPNGCQGARVHDCPHAACIFVEDERSRGQPRLVGVTPRHADDLDARRLLPAHVVSISTPAGAWTFRNVTAHTPSRDGMNSIVCRGVVTLSRSGFWMSGVSASSCDCLSVVE